MLVIYVYMCVFCLTFFSLVGLVSIGYLVGFVVRRLHSRTRLVPELSVPKGIPLVFPEDSLELD